MSTQNLKLDYDKMSSFFNDLMNLVEEKDYNDIWLPALMKLVALSAVEKGVDIENDMAQYFAQIPIDGENTLACVSISSDMTKLLVDYIASGHEEVMEGVMYVLKGKSIDISDSTPILSDEDGTDTVH